MASQHRNLIHLLLGVLLDVQYAIHKTASWKRIPSSRWYSKEWTDSQKYHFWSSSSRGIRKKEQRGHPSCSLILWSHLI